MIFLILVCLKFFIKKIMNEDLILYFQITNCFGEGEKKEIIDIYFMKLFYKKIINPIEISLIFLFPPLFRHEYIKKNY